MQRTLDGLRPRVKTILDKAARRQRRRLANPGAARPGE
jgi:hypothetical protein